MNYLAVVLTTDPSRVGDVLEPFRAPNAGRAVRYSPEEVARAAELTVDKFPEWTDRACKLNDEAEKLQRRYLASVKAPSAGVVCAADVDEQLEAAFMDLSRRPGKQTKRLARRIKRHLSAQEELLAQRDTMLMSALSLVRSESTAGRLVWDWWRLGGAWSGLLTHGSFTPKEMEHQECPKCGEQCGSFGEEGWQVIDGGAGNGIAISDMRQDIRSDCDLCHGTGWPTTQDPKDIGSAADLRAAIALDPDRVPYVLITPDGQWHARGREALPNQRVEDYSEEDWSDRVRQLLDQHISSYPGLTAAVIHCHG